MCVGRRKAGRIEIEDITRLGPRLEPRGGRRGKDLEFDDALLVAQQLRVDFDVGKHTADVGCLLRCHAAMLVEFDRGLSHGALASMRCASDRSTALIEIISIAARCGGAPGTMIMV